MIDVWGEYEAGGRFHFNPASPEALTTLIDALAGRCLWVRVWVDGVEVEVVGHLPNHPPNR